MIGLLFEYGCDPTKRNKKKQTPQDMCQNNLDLFTLIENLYFNQKVRSIGFLHFFLTIIIGKSVQYYKVCY